MVLHSNPKDSGLNVGFFTVSGQSMGLIPGLFWTARKPKFRDYFSDSPEFDYENDFRTVHVHNFVCIAKK